MVTAIKAQHDDQMMIFFALCCENSFKISVDRLNETARFK